MRRLNGRFAKEPRRGVDPAEQRQIEAFIARNGVKRVEPADGYFSAAYNRVRGEFVNDAQFLGFGRVPARGHAP